MTKEVEKKKDNKNKSSAELLTMYINSGGKDATYDDVKFAVEKEKVAKFFKNPFKTIWEYFF